LNIEILREIYCGGELEMGDMSQEDIHDTALRAIMYDHIEKGTIYGVKDETLLQYLRILAIKRVESEANHPHWINKATLISNILNSRYMKKVDKRNCVLTCVIIVLSVVAVVASFIR
jgi:hypothetical protein